MSDELPMQHQLLLKFFSSIPFNKLLGMQIDAVDDGYIRMSLPFRDELIGDLRRPALHGGVTSALIDTCAGGAIFTRVAATDSLSTVDLRVDYLRPGLPETLYAEARVLRLGNRVGVADVVAYQSDGKDAPIATGRGVYNILRKPV